MGIPGYLTPSAQAAFCLGKNIAEGRRERLSTLHLLYGILSCDDCGMTTLLLQMRYDLVKLRSSLKTALSSHASGNWDDGQPTVEFIDALKRSNREAELLNSQVGSVHLVLGFILENTLAKLFLDKSVNIAEIKVKAYDLYLSTGAKKGPS